MDPYYKDDAVTLYHGDCRDVLKTLPDASVDAVVTDPPYELGFMGRKWDNSGIAYDATLWAEVLRVLKPGGHLLAFGGTRTWHRLACAIEDAGFEVRDSLAYMYGSGFPKSLNVSKAMGDNRCRCSMGELADGESATEHDVSRLSVADVPTPVSTSAGEGPLLLAAMPEPSAPAAARQQLPAAEDGRGESGVEGWGDVQAPEGQLRRPEVCPLPAGVHGDGEVGRLHHGAPPSDGAVDRSHTGAVGSGEPHQPRPEGQPQGEPGVVPEQRGSQAWRGWPLCARCGKPSIPDGLGTALKPAFEPVVVARKPLIGTVAENVLTHGTGALNVDASRIAHDSESAAWVEKWSGHEGHPEQPGWGSMGQKFGGSDKGRWPANVILDEWQAAELDAMSGERPGGSFPGPTKGNHDATSYSIGNDYSPARKMQDTGGASRFFYTAKADSSERPRVEGVAHPTVKPLDLMRYLVRLVTPPGGTVLEPFAGSGTTLEACIVEGFKCIGVEMTDEYLPLIVWRVTKPIETVML